MSFVDISYLKLLRPLCLIMLEEIIRNISMKLFFNLDRFFRRRCGLKIFLIYSSGILFFDRAKPFVHFFGRGNYKEHFYEFILNFDEWIRRRCRLKIVLIYSADGPFIQRSVTIFASFGRIHHEEQFCEIILNLNQWFRRRCHLNAFLIYSSGGHFVRWSKTICAIFVEGIIRNISAKLFRIWTSDSGENVV